ncbi:chromosome segregation protein [Niveomyces insectorum RCEF 264]|uniref:Chromosome segregation protein n=1 Tax=Niveomyces insectorum RCEF 264 TaxID=1081102 RepID=A0A168ABH1_9HYPO|nr:chromosome segregation protein [Niveomyces insectorum RCEF 264]
MARRPPSSLLSLVESDSEDDLGGVARGASAAAAAAAKKPTPSIRDMPATKRGRPAAAAGAGAASNRVTKTVAPKKSTSRANEKKEALVAAAVDREETTTRGRRALADKTNEQAAIDSAAISETTTAAKGKGRPGRKAAAVVEQRDDSDTEMQPAAKKRGRGRPKTVAAEEPDEQVEDTAREQELKPKKTTAGRGRRLAAPAKTAEDVTMGEDDEESGHQGQEVPETQFVDSMDVEEAEDINEEQGDTTAADALREDGPSTVPSSYLSPIRHSKPLAPSPARRVRGITSTDSSSDASVRRRLGDMTKKYDALEARYRDLREIGIREAERNFDRLKKQGDDRAKASSDLVASLKAELTTYRELAKDGARAKREWEASEARATDLQAQVGELMSALGDAKAEAKTLATKLAAARTDVGPNGLLLSVGTGPGSALKSSAHNHHGALGNGPATAAAGARAAVEALQATTQLAQLKEDLYGDLTGLLVRSAKRDGSRELYDCIQTGRHGSLHFKLCIDNDEGGGGSGADGEDDAQFVYTPQLDANRDAALIDRLPDYLVEEISFPRVQAAKFYKRVMQALAEM